MTEKHKIKREELEKLGKSQLISFIMKNFTSCNEGEAKVCVAEPPTDFKNIKLPPKPPGIPLPGVPPKDVPPACPVVPAVPAVPGGFDAKKTKEIPPPEKLEGFKKIFVKCEKCNKTYIIDLPRKIVLENPLEVVPVTIMHAKDHALTVYLDQNFESRRDYVSELFYLD